MSNKVFVGGVSWGTDSEGLRDAFAQFGQVIDAKIITDRETGKSRGFGFVTYVDEESALKAIENGDGMDLDGRTIRVNHATQRDQPRDHRGRRDQRDRNHTRRRGSI